jgi:hypothetical protein
MKITIEFDDQEDAKLALDAFDWKHTVMQLDQYLREVTKRDFYLGTRPTEDEYKMAEHLREKIREFVNDNNLTLS